jgi:hypothetical protein
MEELTFMNWDLVVVGAMIVVVFGGQAYGALRGEGPRAYLDLLAGILIYVPLLTLGAILVGLSLYALKPVLGGLALLCLGAWLFGEAFK